MQGRCLGALEGIKRAASKEECHAHCAHTPLCYWSTFDPDHETCTLTNDCPVIDKTCTECTASEKGCLTGMSSSSSSTHQQYESPEHAEENGHAVEPNEALVDREEELLKEGKGNNHSPMFLYQYLKWMEAILCLSFYLGIMLICFYIQILT